LKLLSECIDDIYAPEAVIMNYMNIVRLHL